MNRYTRNDLLVEPEWIEEHRNDSDVRLIDCRPEAAYRQQPSRFTPAAQPKRIILFEELKERFAEPHVKLLNLLPRSYWSGADNPFEKRHPGHIPGAANIDSNNFLDRDGNFKSAAELDALLSDAGISATDEVVVHCQAGVRTTTGFFVLSLLGSDSVRAYDGAMAEWANRDDVPVETG